MAKLFWIISYFAFGFRDFIKDVLGPTLANNSITSSLKLMIYDDNRDHLFDYANVVNKIDVHCNIMTHVLALTIWQLHTVLKHSQMSFSDSK